jgi:hypothetical protein
VTNLYAGYSKEVIEQFGCCAEKGTIEEYVRGLKELLQRPEFNNQKREQIQGLYGRYTFEAFSEELYRVIEEE